MGKFIDETGNRYGKLIVLEYADSDRWKNARWLCQCDCGSQHIVKGASLRQGATKSCGCLIGLKSGEKFVCVLCTEEKDSKEHCARRMCKLCYGKWYNRKNKDRRREPDRKYHEKRSSTINGCLKVRLTRMKQRAKKLKMPCKLTFTDLKSLFEGQNGKCYYSGEQMTADRDRITSVSVDRLDSNFGYTLDNIVLCCSTVNYMKQRLSPKELLSWCRKIVLHNNKNN